MSNELVGPEEVAKSLIGKRLDICGTSRESVNPRFLSTTSVRLLQAFFVGLGSFCLAIGRLQLDLLLSMKQKGSLEAWQLIPVKKNWNWRPEQVSLFPRALKWHKKATQKHRG